MEEKINNQKIFSYVPSVIIKIILESSTTDKDVFCDNIDPLKKVTSSKSIIRYNNKFSRYNSIYINQGVFPMETVLQSSLVMSIRLRGFQKLISTLVIKDPKNHKEKIISEYISIITPRILLKLSGIISENGGEIVKYNDFELTAIWVNYKNNNKTSLYNAKLGIICAVEIMKKVNKSEISRGVKLEVSIGMDIGDVSCVFFGGERKRSEFVFLGDALEQAQLCLQNCIRDEIVIGKELNTLLRKGGEITTIGIDEDNRFYSLIGYSETKLKDFSKLKGLKLNNNIIFMNKSIYENLSKKIHILSSILPQKLIRYLDLGIESNLQEINVITIVTILIYFDPEVEDYLSYIQNIIFDIQKATYITFGTLLHISKIENGYLVRCVWGMEPGSFIDDTARAIASSSIIGSLTKFYKIKIGIGISTGSCFSGLITLQGNKKYFTLFGKKVNLSRLLANEAFKNVLGDENKPKYLIFCDKMTKKRSQKWYRHVFVSQFRININKRDNVYQSRDDFYYGSKNEKLSDIEENGQANLSDLEKNNKKYTIKRNKKSKKRKSIFKKILKKSKVDNDEFRLLKTPEKEYKLINEIYTPIEEEEYFIPNYYDPFPLIRTHLKNSFNPKNSLYFINLLKATNSDNIYESKTKYRNHTMAPYSIHKAQSEVKMMKKLKDSQTIFGHSKEIQRFLNIINEACSKCRRQFFLVRGPMGVGKTLFVRKCLNNFIGLNDYLSKNYYTGDQFLFSNAMNPFTSTLPYNTINFILRDIFLNIKKIEKIRELCKISEELQFNNEDLNNASFILSIGKNDIDLQIEFDRFKTINTLDFQILRKTKKKRVRAKGGRHESLKTRLFSVVGMIEGPYNFNNCPKLNEFFFRMIKLYKKYLNSNKEYGYFKYNSYSGIGKRSKSKDKNKNKNKNFMKKMPLIFVLDDIDQSNKFSIDFIQYLYNNDDKELKPFIIILIEQIPLNENYRPLTHRIFENFLLSFSDCDCQHAHEDKIVCFEIKPLMDKSILEKLIIYNYKEAVMNTYKTNLQKVDDKILEFLLIKTFHGIPFLVLSLFESLIKSEKFIQILSGEIIITSGLMDDINIFDWSDILLPYIYEKMAMMAINNTLAFKEKLLLEYASVIGTVFDIKTLDKLNPIKNFVKMKDLERILLKINNEYFIEIFTDEVESQKNKAQNLICQITFPLMREVLHQQFPMEKRSTLHMQIAKILSTTKKNIFFSNENELKILKRHLLYSEMNIISEIESKEIRTLQDILQNKKVLNYNNLKLYIVKKICSKFYSNYNGSLMEGNLEMCLNNKWLKVSYFIKGSQIYISLKNPKKVVSDFIKIIPIKDIYKNGIITKDSSKLKNNNLLTIYVSKETKPMNPKITKKFLFSSEKREEICKLDITINFMRVKVSYDKYVNNFGISRFPLYKTKWYLKKSLMYYSHYEQQGISINSMNSIMTVNKYFQDPYNSDKLFNKSKLIKKSFNLIIQSTLGIFLGKIQEKLNIKMNNLYSETNEEEYSRSNSSNLVKFIHYIYLYFFTTPKHVKNSIDNFAANSASEIEISNKPTKRQSQISFRNSFIIMNPYFSIKDKNNETNYKKNKSFKSCLKKKLNTEKSVEKNKNDKNNNSKNKKASSFKKIRKSKSQAYDEDMNNEKNDKGEDKINMSSQNYINIIMKNKNRKKKLSLFAPDILRRSLKRFKTNKHNTNINRESLLLQSKNKLNLIIEKNFENNNKKNYFSSNSDNKFAKVEKINQNVENDDDDIVISDLDFDDDDDIPNLHINSIVQSFDSSKVLNSEEDKETNYISNKNDNVNNRDKKIFKIPNILNLKKYANIHDNNDNENEQMTYREKNKINIFNPRQSLFKSENNNKNNYLNTSREYPNNKNGENGKINLYKENKNKKYEEMAIHAGLTHKKKNKLPGDFVPRIKENGEMTQHVQLIPSFEIENKIRIHTLENSFNKSFNDEFNKSNIFKTASILDNPKYSYIEDNHNNVKVHKSNLLKVVKAKDRNKK